jgi:antitoxin CptB
MPMQRVSANTVDDAASALHLLHRGHGAQCARDCAEGRVGERLDARRLDRIRWRCRRGMLENDLVLARFLAAHGEALTEDDVARLDRLLALPDNELWDLIARRAEPDDPSLAPLLEVLRN